MRRAAVIIFVCILVWASAGFVKPAFSHAAEVRDVASRDLEGSTRLDIMVLHDVETSMHYVDTIEVTWGANITSLTIGPKSLATGGAFTVDYNMGPVSGTVTIVVRARCSVTGYSGATSWTGVIPEPSPIPTTTPSPTPDVSPSPFPSPTETPSPSQIATESPSPTPTPSIPEFPSFLAPILLVALTVIALLLYSKRQFGFLK